MVYAFCFQVPCWMLYSPIGAQPLGFSPLQPFGVYPWQALVCPGDGHWSILGMHWLAAPSTALGRGDLYAALSSGLQPFQQYGGANSFGGLCLPYMVGRGLLFQVWLHLMTWLTLNLWWALYLVILVWISRYQVDEFTRIWFTVVCCSITHLL